MGWSQELSYDYSNYIDAKDAYLKSDYKTFSKIVKRELSKKDHPNIFINLANTILSDIDPSFIDNLTDKQKEIAKFSKDINEMHEKNRKHDIYLAYKNCAFIDKLSADVLYRIQDALEDISFEEHLKVSKLNLKHNGEHYRFIWDIGNMGNMSDKYRYFDIILSDPFFNDYPQIKAYAKFYKDHNEENGFSDWDNYINLYHIKDYLETYPNDAMAHRRLGHVYKALFQYENAKASYLKAFTLDPFYSDGISFKDTMVMSYLLNEEETNIKNSIKEFIAQKFPNASDNYESLKQRLNIHLDSRNYNAARTTIANILKQKPNDAFALAKLAYLDYVATRYKDALLNYDKLPDTVKYNNLGIYYQYLNTLVKTESFDRVLEEWEKFIDEDFTGTTGTYSTYYNYFYDANEKETALDFIERGVTTYPRSAWLLRVLGNCQLELNLNAEALKNLKESIYLEPSNTWAHNKYKLVLENAGKSIDKEFKDLYNDMPYSYDLAKKHINDDNYTPTSKTAEFVWARNFFYAKKSNQIIPNFTQKYKDSKTALDSLFYGNLLFSEYRTYDKKNRLDKETLNNVIKLSDDFLRLGGNKKKYHYNRAYFYRSLNEEKLSKTEIQLAIKTDPNNHTLIRESIVYLNNGNGFVPLRKSLDRDYYNYSNIERYIWINNKYNGSNINSIWAYNKCKENFPNKSCSKVNYNDAIEALGDPYRSMQDYKESTNLGTTKRYINWYNSSRQRCFNSKKEVIYDMEENKVTTIDENGVINILKDDPNTGKPILKQKGKVWIKYGYTDNGNIENIKTSANASMQLKYNDKNQITTLTSSDKGTIDFTYNEQSKPIIMVVNKKDTIRSYYNPKTAEIDSVRSNAGARASLLVTQIFQDFTQMTQNFDLDDIRLEDETYKALREKYDDASYSIYYDASKITTSVIEDHKNFVRYLKNNLSNDANYATNALDISFEMMSYLNNNLDTKLKIQLLDFASFAHTILLEIRRRGVANDYWNRWNETLSKLETEKQNQKQLNAYRKKIEDLQTNFRNKPIKLLASAEWLPKSSFTNNAYWMSTNLNKIHPSYDFASTKPNGIIKRKNGDVLIAFNQGIALKRNGFWQFLYYDTLNKRLIENSDLINIKSKTTFNNFVETDGGSLIINTSSGTFLLDNYAEKLQKIKIKDDNYIGNSSSKLLMLDTYLVLYNSSKINLITTNNNEFKLETSIDIESNTFDKIIGLYNDYNTLHFLIQTQKGIDRLTYNVDTKTRHINSLVSIEGIKDFTIVDTGYYDTILYFLADKKLYKTYIEADDNGNSTYSKLEEVLDNIVYNKHILGLSTVPVNSNENVLGVITDIGINLYKDNHFEFYKIDAKDGLDELTQLYYSNNETFSLLTKKRLITFSLEDYFYSNNKPSKIKSLKKKGITLILENNNLYFSNSQYLYNDTVETDGWGSKITDFDISDDDTVYFSDYNTLNKVTFNASKKDSIFYNVEEVFSVNPFNPEDFYVSNNAILSVKIAKDGTLWAATKLSVFRYNENKTPQLKEFNFFKDKEDFPAKTLEVFNLIETYDGKIMVINSSEPWNDYKGIELDGGLVVYNTAKDKFEFIEDDKNTPNFPWFITSYTPLNPSEAILGTTSGFAYHSLGGIKSFRASGDKSYLDVVNAHKNLFLGTEGVQFEDFILFGCAEGIVAYKDKQWFYPDRLNQLLPKFSEHGLWGGNKVNTLAVDHLDRLLIGTDLGLLVVNSNKIDPYDLLIMSREPSKLMEYHNVEKLKEERELLISSLPQNSTSKKVIEKAELLKKEIDDLVKIKSSFARDFKLKDTQYKTINIDSVDNEINRITKRHSDLLLTLKEKNPVIYQTLKIPPLSIAGIRSKLRPNECIVQYIPLNKKVIIQVVTKDELILKEVEVGKKELFNLALVASDLLSSKGLVRGAKPKSTSKEKTINNDDILDDVLLQLYINLISPIRDEILPYKNRIQVIAEGALNYLPFESLIYKDGKDKKHYALEEFNFTYLSSLYMLQLLYQFPENQDNTSLLVGDPDNTLPYARQEVEDIAKQMQNQPVLLVGKNASLKKFKANTSDKAIIHLATHGFVDRKTIKDSWLIFSDSKLTLSEIYELNLDETGLMVLSACETGIGKDGLETTSLARAFANAGVQYLIASLWKVNDESTKILMTKFYDEMYNGVSYMQALHNAKLHLINYQNGKYSHPKYWSAFLIFGKA